MKILYVAPNIDRHHSIFARELISIIGDINFKYATYRKGETERLNMGFLKVDEDWVIDIIAEPGIFEDWFENADVVLCSARNCHVLMYKRLVRNKLTFYFSERWFKDGFGKFRLLHPYILYLYFKFKHLSKYLSFYYLAQGYYAASDFKWLRLCPNRIFIFGYFTDVNSSKLYNPSVILDNNKINILWCGRFLNWKRVDILVRAFAFLLRKNSQLQVHLTLVGDGVAKNKIKKMLEILVPKNTYTLLSFLPMDVVRSLMKQADIYVLPSNGYEGWGAVINEAMAESCVVVASDKTGGGKTMIENGHNGFLFPSGKPKKLGELLYNLTIDKELREQIVSNSLHSINNIWSPQIAANRFYSICESIIEKRETINFVSGPLALYK